MKITEGPGRYFADWVRAERLHNGWSLAQLAADMTERGCRMDGSAVSRIESGQRQVTVPEAAAFARLIGRPLSMLVRPRSMATSREADRLLQWHVHFEREIRRLRTEQVRVEQQLVDLVDSADEVADVLSGLQRAGLSSETAADLLARFRSQDPRNPPHTIADFLAQPPDDEEPADA